VRYFGRFREDGIDDGDRFRFSFFCDNFLFGYEFSGDVFVCYFQVRRGEKGEDQGGNG
jgi:hypothetical protein